MDLLVERSKHTCDMPTFCNGCHFVVLKEWRVHTHVKEGRSRRLSLIRAMLLLGQGLEVPEILSNPLQLHVPEATTRISEMY
jgi:hypothetical protein